MKTNMKTFRSILLIVIAASCLQIGCKKKPEPVNLNPTTPAAALSAVRKAFPNPGPDIAPSLDKVMFSMRYGEYQGVLTELDKLSAMPNLTAEQKTVLSNASEQIKKAMAAKQ
jgi:hypothetical protein